MNLVGWILPIAFFIYIMRRGMNGMAGGGLGGLGGGARSGGSKSGIFGFGQSTARIIKENTGVTFK